MKVTSGVFGNVEIKELVSHIPEDYQRLSWSHEREIDTTTDNKLWLLDEAVNADFGYIENGQYIVFSDNSDDIIDPEPFCGFVAISIPQQCEPDFAIAKGILDTLWELSADAYEVGFKDGVNEV